MNINQTWADERGVTAVIIDPSTYNGTEPMEIKAIQQQWILEKFWYSYLITIFGGGCALFLYQLYSAKSPDEFDKQDPDLKEELLFAILCIADHYKDILYTIRFPHSSASVTFWLWFSLFAPFSIVWVVNRSGGGNILKATSVFF